MRKKFFWPLEKSKVLLLALLVLGVLAQSLTMVRSGLVYDFGVGFWGPNGHDGVWHLALANQVLKGFPPPHPTFAGLKLTNYHYFYDLVLALVNRLTGISIRALYFQIFPTLLAVGLGIFSFLVGFWWKKDFWVGFWLAFFNFFAGSFGWVVTWWCDRQIGGESLFWSMQSISTLINPPYALSLIFLLAGILLLLRTKKWSLGKIFIVGLVFGLLINIKAYAGIIGLGSLGVLGAIKFFRRGESVYLRIFGLALAITILIFLPINRQASSLFVFKPFWFVHSMIESPDRLYLPRLATARYVFAQHGIDPRLIALEVFGLVVFLAGNLGTRLIGGWDLLGRFRKEKTDEFDGFLLTGMAIGLLMPLFWIQKGTAWNTIQFFYYFLFFANFYAAATMAEITKIKGKRRYWVLFLVVILTIPTTLGTLKGYLGWPPPAAISREELGALEFLDRQKSGVVLTYPYDPFAKRSYTTTPVPLFAYESTAYISAFSGQPVFLEDEVNLTISGYDWQKRHDEAMNFFESQKWYQARGFLVNNDIDYIYLVEDQKLNFPELRLEIEKIFENEEVRIWKVN